MKKINRNQKLIFNKVTILELDQKKKIRGGFVDATKDDPHETTKDSKNCPPDEPVTV